MAISMADLGLHQMIPPPVLPFGVGPIPLNNIFNQPDFLSDNFDKLLFPWQQSNEPRLPWQHNYHDSPLQHLLEQNKLLLDTPFSQQYTQNNDNMKMKQRFPWQQDQGKVFQQDNFNKDKESKSHSKRQEWSEPHVKTMNYVLKDNKENNEKMEKSNEHFEKWLKKTEKQKKQTFAELMFYVILLYPFLIYDRPGAYYFSGTKMLSYTLSKYGISIEDDVMFMLFVQCVDILALMRGQLKFVDGYKSAWYQELYDYVLTKLGFNATFRYGTQMIMPQSGAPVYSTE